MSLTDIAHRINELASSWEQFKLINDRKLKEIESKGRADSATIEQLCKVNNAIDSCKERLDLIETAAQRPEVNTDFSTSDKYFLIISAREWKAVYHTKPSVEMTVISGGI